VVVHPATGDAVRKRPAVVERMSRIVVGGDRPSARLWLRDGDPLAAVFGQNQAAAIEFTGKTLHLGHLTSREMAERIAMEHPDIVNAVEVVDQDGNGAVVYPEWP
jgi:hypothetical protein